MFAGVYIMGVLAVCAEITTTTLCEDTKPATFSLLGDRSESKHLQTCKRGSGKFEEQTGKSNSEHHYQLLDDSQVCAPVNYVFTKPSQTCEALDDQRHWNKLGNANQDVRKSRRDRVQVEQVDQACKPKGKMATPSIASEQFEEDESFSLSSEEDDLDDDDEEERTGCFRIRKRLGRLFGSDDSDNEEGQEECLDEGRRPFRRRRLHTHVYVKPDRLPHSVPKTFLSVALGSFIPRRLNKVQFDPDSERLHVLASALTPCTLRLGGNRMLMQLFSPDGSKDNLVKPSTVEEFERTFNASFWGTKVGKAKNLEHFLLTGEQWDRMYAFISKVGWELLYDFNNMLYTDGVWDPTNASMFLKYSAEKGYKIEGFQLGNEPNQQGGNFAVGVTPDDLARDTKLMKDLVLSFPLYKDSKIYGPDVTKAGLRKYFGEFMNAGGKDVVDYASFHHYYYDGRKATVRDCLSLKMYARFEHPLKLAEHMMKWHAKGKPLTLTETGSFFGGGAPDISNRFVAGFLWLDKLGLSAKAGLQQVFRQTFYGGHYSMIAEKTYDPLPDYFLSLLFKRLVEGPVFKVSFAPHILKLRMYANKARTDSEYGYPENSLVIYYLNAHSRDIQLDLVQFNDRKKDLFILTGAFGGLSSRHVKLNGKQLEMRGNELPPMPPKSHEGHVLVPRFSFGFIVIPDAGCPHFRKILGGRRPHDAD